MNALSFIVKSIAPEVDVVYEPDSFTCFDHDLEAVVIGNDFQLDDRGFMRHIVETHDFAQAYDYSLMLWSVLHELGHYFTGDDGWVDEEEANQYLVCSLVPSEIADDPKIQDLYFNIPSEYEATEWAIDWIKANPELATRFNNMLK
jgi:hypothetical protein